MNWQNRIYRKRNEPNAQTVWNILRFQHALLLLALSIMWYQSLFVASTEKGVQLYPYAPRQHVHASSNLQTLSSSPAVVTRREPSNATSSSTDNWKTNAIPIPALPERRQDRFPSVDERVRIYMSDWYVPPCENYLDGFTNINIRTRYVTLWNQYRRPTKVGKLPVLASLWAGYPQVFIEEARKKSLFYYNRDLVDRMIPALHRIGWNNDTDAHPETFLIPLLIQFGDKRHSKSHGYMNVPHFKKFRSSYSVDELDFITKTTGECHDTPRPLTHGNSELESIVWKLNSQRHYGMLPEVQRSDIAWEDKVNKGIFRGKNTGQYINFPNDVAQCFSMERCRLTYNLANSTLIDAKLTDDVKDYINGVRMTTDAVMPIKDQLRYKAIVMLEGIDVATGLKWALYSNSVVLMKPPTRTTFAMEERLEPWVHYVPLNEQLTDVEEKMQWVIDHDAHAKAIAKRATLWIEDLLYHRDADKENAMMEDEILRRYLKHFHVMDTVPDDEKKDRGKPTQDKKQQWQGKENPKEKL